MDPYPESRQPEPPPPAVPAGESLEESAKIRHDVRNEAYVLSLEDAEMRQRIEFYRQREAYNPQAVRH